MPVATRAAAAALHEASQADVLDLVLANVAPSLHQRDVCALLCTSRATAAVLVRNSSGCLAVSATPSTPAQSQALSRWLATHSRLLRSLEVSLKVSKTSPRPQWPVDVLPDLTGLQSLRLSRPWFACEFAHGKGDGPATADALRPLTQLTELVLQGVRMDWQQLGASPASLQCLVVRCADRLDDDDDGLDLDTRGASLQLGHLTALTQLDFGAQDTGLRDGDVLPPNLVRLDSAWANVNILKGLSSLRHLNGCYNVEQLLEFAAAGMLTQLTYVGLSHGFEDWDLGGVVQRLTDAGVAGVVRGVELTNEYASESMWRSMLAALKRLPVQSLELDEGIEYQVSSLSALTQLCRLNVQVKGFTSDEYAALPGELSKLPSLRELVLHRPYWDTAVAAAHDVFVAHMSQSRPQLHVKWCW